MSIAHACQACQVDLLYRGHEVSVVAAETSLGWNWAALIDSRFALEGDQGALDTPMLALSIGKMQVKRLIDTRTVSTH